MTGRFWTQAPTVEAIDGEVVIDVPAASTLPPEAARVTAERLRAADHAKPKMYDQPQESGST